MYNIRIVYKKLHMINYNNKKKRKVTKAKIMYFYVAKN